MKRKILFAEKHLDIPSFKNHSAWDMTKMVRDISKLNKIIKEHVHDGIKNLKSYSNNILFEEIFNAYNKDLPLCYNINNNVKNRKMVFNKIKRLWKKSSENVEKSNISDMSIMFDKLNEFESTKINSNFEVENNELGLNDRQLNDDENCALDALLSLCENEEIPDLLNTNSQINSNEKCALDVLLSICEVKDDLHRTINEDDMCILESLMRLYEDTENFKMESKVINTEEKVYESLEDNNCNDIIFKGANESHCKNIELCLNELKSEVKGMFDYLKQILPIIVNSCSLEKNNTNLINFDNCSVEKVDNKINNIKKINKEKDNFIDTFTLKEDVFTSKNNEDINSCNINEVYDEVVENTTTYNNLSKIEASNKKDYVLQSNGNSFNNTKNVKNKTATLGPFETTGSSLELSKFEKYRKVPNPKEQLNKSVKRLDGNSSKNVRKFKKKFLDSEFEINPKLIFEAEDDPKLNLTKNKFVLDVIRQEYLKINNTCIVSFFSTKNLKSGILVYGYCSFPDCVNYRFSINLSGNVSVYRSGEICHAKGEERVSQMRGVTRKIVKKELKNKSAYLYRKEQILNAADEVAESGNFQNIQKLSTLRKCRSEALLDDCYDPDPFIDVFLMQQSKYKNYIQHVASPLTVYCWEEATFETFAKNPQILKDANYTIHFDASGQSVRQIMIAEKRILVYKIVIRIKKFKMVFPIVTAILSRHTLNDICGILEKLKTFCIQHKYKWPFFQRVCTDFSYALIGAVLKCCNDSNVSEYLQVCFNYLENPKNKKPKVFIQLCKSHYAHTISHDLNNKIGKKNRLRYLLWNVLGLAFDLKSMDECKFWFRHLFIVLLYPKKNDTFNESLNILKNNMLETDDNKDYEENIMDDKDNKNFESISSKSPFRKMFLQIYNSIKESIKDIFIKGENNEYQNEDLCNFIINKYCSFIPMWTNIMGILVDPSSDHLSNAPVEYNFFLQKHILLNNKTVRPGAFIKIDRKDNMSSLKELRYKYDMFKMEQKMDNDNMDCEIQEQLNKLLSDEHCSRLEQNDKRDQKCEDEEESSEPEEKWEKKNSQKRKSINPKHMLNSKKIKKFQTNTEDMNNIINIDLSNSIDSTSSFRNYRGPIKAFNCDYYLFRYNKLFKSIYPKLSQLDIGFYNYLQYSDWVSLNKGCQLTNFVLDSAMLCFIKDNFNNVLSLPCQLNEICFERVNKLLSFKPEYLIIPILKCGHFNVCILKHSTREFIFIDSLYDDSGEYHYRKFISKAVETHTWKFVKILDRTKQSDGFSCGIFVILYVISYINGEKLTNLQNPDLFRDTIKSTLIRNADDCSLFCCYCSNTKRSTKKCSLCDYRVCSECIIRKCSNCFQTCEICNTKIL